MRYTLSFAAALALSACVPAAVPAGEEAAPRGEPAGAASQPDPGRILGVWRIAAVNGATPRAQTEDAGTRRTPRLTFTASTYGGTTGCNFFGGMGLLESGRYFTAPGPQTLIGCGDLTAQEQAITGILAAAPEARFGADGSLELVAGGEALLLRRDPAVAEAHPPPAEPEVTPLLAGTGWRIGSVDGAFHARPGVPLRFEAESWWFETPCGVWRGRWRQQGDRIVPLGPPTAAPTPCGADATRTAQGLAALLAAGGRLAVGPNGELLLAGGGRRAVGERMDAGADSAARLLGSWAVAAIDGQAPAEGSRPVLSFGVGGYRGGTGCNSIQGLFIARGGRLFTYPGPQTEMGCGALTAQETRITGLLAASPRIALAAGGAVALVDRAGRLDLRRTGGPQAVEGAPRALSLPPTPFEAELRALDGEVLRMRIEQPVSRFRLEARRWEAQVGCVPLTGVWRREEGERAFFTDRVPDAPAACSPALVARDRKLMRLMNGRARAIAGANGELLIAGDEHWLTGDIVRRRSR